jgi:8-oxo-dGTP pyrophosphatase MutT (NUDIX family)
MSDASLPEPGSVIPSSNLPPGFADTVGHMPDTPAEARPASTAVLIRDGADGLEVLLLRRNRSAGFGPGAYVFPGGRVDASDAEVAILERVTGTGGVPDPDYWVAAAREMFEETGVVLADGASAIDADELERWRDALMRDEATMLDVLDAAGVGLDLSRMLYFAHWITPVVEPRRYDTRFFIAALPDGARAQADPREMSDAAWLSPADALRRFGEGLLPMVFPTLRTLEALDGFANVEEVLAHFRGREVKAILPRLVRTDDGVGIVVDG